MTLDLGTVAREAAARWRRDRVLLVPLAGLLLFVPQWAVLLLVPDPPQLPAANAGDVAAATAWALAVQRWAASYGLGYVAAFLLAQLGQLAIVTLYVAPGGQPTLGGAIVRAAARLLRFVLAGAAVAMPLAGAGMIALGAPVLLIAVLPGLFYVLGRTLLVGAAIAGRPGTGALRAIRLSWQWTRGSGLALALLVGALLIGVSALADAAAVGIAALAKQGVDSPALVAALDGLAAAGAAAAMTALAMMQTVLYRRLAR